MKVLVIDAAYCVYKDVETIGVGTLIIYENLLETKNDISLLFDKDVINCGKEKIVNYVIENKYEVICFSTRSDTYPYVLSISKKLKLKDSNIKVILGGPQATLTAKKTMERYNSIDIIVKGPGEGIIQKIINSKFDENKLSKINNIFFRGSKELCETEYVKSSYKIKFPLIGFNNYNKLKYINEIYIEAGRGCTFNCTYCVTNKVWDKTYFIREPREILSEIVNIKKVIDFKKISFIHDNILSNKEIGKKFLINIINDFPNDIVWTASARIDLLDSEIITLLKKAGCSGIYFGLETGSQKMQKIYNKNINLDKAIDNFINLDKKGVNFTVSLIIGHPDENLDDLFESIYIGIFLKGLDSCSCIQFHKLAFVYGSTLYEKYKQSLVFKEEEISDQANILLDDEEKNIIKSDKELFSTFYSYQGKNSIDNIFIKQKNIEIIINTYYKCLNIIMKQLDLETFKKSIMTNIDSREEFINWIKSFKNRISEYFDGCLELENTVYEIINFTKIEFDNIGINKTIRFIKNDSFNLIVWKTKENVVLYEKHTKEKENIINSLKNGKMIKSKKKTLIINKWKEDLLIK